MLVPAPRLHPSIREGGGHPVAPALRGVSREVREASGRRRNGDRGRHRLRIELHQHDRQSAGSVVDIGAGKQVGSAGHGRVDPDCIRGGCRGRSASPPRTSEKRHPHRHRSAWRYPPGSRRRAANKPTHSPARGERLMKLERDAPRPLIGEARRGREPGRALPRGLRHPRLLTVGAEAVNIGGDPGGGRGGPPVLPPAPAGGDGPSSRRTVAVVAVDAELIDRSSSVRLVDGLQVLEVLSRWWSRRRTATWRRHRCPSYSPGP